MTGAVADPLAAKLTTALGGRFELHEACGTGAQGNVYRAFRVRAPDGSVADDEVALKLYSDEALHERVQREVGALLSIRHPTISKLVESGVVTIDGNQVCYLAFDFVHGMALASRLKDVGTLNATVTAIVGRDIATAIDQLWRSTSRIVHRDIKPSNIMLRVGEREAVLVDLGISKFQALAPITTIGQMLGTPGYMSPEQLAGETLTCLADVFSLGVTLVEVSLGRHPTGGSQFQLLKTVEVGQLLPTAPYEMVDLMQRMVSQEPENRPNPDEVASICSSGVAAWRQL